MDTTTGLGLYELGEKVAEFDAFRLYLCTQKSSGRQCLLQVAATAEQNGDLDRAKFVLEELAREAEQLEVQYAEVKEKPDSFLNYGLSFPELVDSFISPEQGDRRISVLAFRGVEEVSKMVPIIGITDKDGLRVDLRTSAWIMGKLLKLLAFAHSEGVLIGNLLGNNILIEPDKHYVVVFDWSKAITAKPAELLGEDKAQEIADAAKAVITVLGGDPETGTIPDDGDEAFKPYSEFLLSLAGGGESSATRAHKRFYEMVDKLWSGFYPFTTKSLN